MWRLAVRSVTAHRARLAMTLAAVGVGTGFLAGTLAFSAAAERAERSIPQRGDVAVRVRPADAQGHLPWSTVDDLAGLSGVARADAVVSGPGAQRLLGLGGRVSAVDLVAAPGVAAGELVGRAQAAVPDARVVDGQAANAEARERRSDELRTLRDALLGLAGVALLVGTLVIANTFSKLVGQRTRELALLRAVGMSRRQVRRMVLA